MASMKALFIFDNIILRLRLISHGSRFFTLSKTFTDKSPIPCPWISRKSVFAHLNYNDYCLKLKKHYRLWPTYQLEIWFILYLVIYLFDLRQIRFFGGLHFLFLVLAKEGLFLVAAFLCFLTFRFIWTLLKDNQLWFSFLFMLPFSFVLFIVSSWILKIGFHTAMGFHNI